MNSITRRLTFWLALTTVCLVSVAATVLFIGVRIAMMRQLDAALIDKAKTLGSLVRIMRDGHVALDIDNVMIPEYSDRPRADYFEIRHADGTDMQLSPSLKKGARIADPRAMVPLNVAWDMKLRDGRSGRAIALQAKPTPDIDDNAPPPPVTADNQLPVTVIVAQGRTTLDRVLQILLIGLAIAAIGSVVVAVLVSRIIIARSLATLYGVSQQAETMGPIESTFVFETAGLPTELLPICNKFNELLQRLQAAFVRERRINADIAHELRTPISELRSLTDVACRWEPTGEQAGEYFRDAHEIALRMERLTNSLLTLARAQAGGTPVNLEAVAVAESVDVIMLRLRNANRLGRAEILNSVPDDCYVSADRLMVERMFENLLDNAAAYATPGGVIETSAERIGDGWAIHIANTNDKLNADDVKHLFEAFWRKDGARSSDQHSGLGLSIVAEYARHLGIAVTPRLLADGRFEMTLDIPAARHAAPLPAPLQTTLS
ncbi:hypothetical protein BH10PLA1_BH10PLA1_17680 [soil metagenome]